MRYLTSGDSHGRALLAILQEFPSGVPIDIDYIDLELKRRQSGYGRGKRMEIESDRVQILSGIRKGLSTGSPIAIMVVNKDWDNWKDKLDDEKDLLNPRPGHADLCGLIKYRLNSLRDVIERSSARETAMRVCIGALAKTVLKKFGIDIFSLVSSIGDSSYDLDYGVTVKGKRPKGIEESEVRCPDVGSSKDMKCEIDRAMQKGESVGGSFNVIASGVVAGLGSYDSPDNRIDAILARAFISIPGIKSFEVGLGSRSGSVLGSQYHDEIYHDKEKGFFRKTNNAGGIEGGMTNGMPIVIKATMKPIPTTLKGLRSVDIRSKEDTVSLKERSDYCAVPSAAVIGESVMAATLLDALQSKFGRDNIEEMLLNYSNYKEYIKKI